MARPGLGFGESPLGASGWAWGRLKPRSWLAPTRPPLCPSCPQPQAAQKAALAGSMAKSGPHLGTPAGSAGAW